MRLLRFTAVLCLLAGGAGAADGFVTAVQEHGVWWLRDGEGRPFFSLGVDCVAGCYGHAENHPVEPARKARIVGQLKAWGFNTAACWSSPSVWPDFYVADQLYARADPRETDVWDEAFWTAGWFPGMVRDEVAAFRGRRNVIGLFVDNEPHWDPEKLFRAYAALPSSAPGSRALVAFARTRYGGPASMNREWGTRLSAFEAIPRARMPKKLPAAMESFLAAWRTEVVKNYYTRYVALVRAADPDHLILGVRWAGLPDLDLYRALSPLFDVNSVNDYTRYGALKAAYGRYYEATGKPIMITEYSFSGFAEPGHRSLQFCDVGSQERRAHGYRKFVSQAARAPFMVGMHWFLWGDYEKQDESRDGYLPDENMGLVSADETRVYDTLVDECARTNAAVDGLHRAAAWAPPPERPPVPYSLPRLIPKVDGDLAEWPVAGAATPYTSESLVEGVESGHRYWLASDGKYLYVGADIKDTRIDDPGEDWCWEGDYLAVYTSPAAAAKRGGTSIYVFPTRGGKDHRRPYAGFWGDRPVPGSFAASRTTTGGYTLEVALPLKALGGRGAPAGDWTIGLSYQDTGGLYTTWWDGRVAFQKEASR
ncbi:MAG: hypothetical protein AAB152_15080 [Candidatus Coatesbacteria bacterium]